MDSSEVTAGTNASALQYNNLRKDLILGNTIQGVDADGATITVDWSDDDKGKVRDITLGGNRTLAFSNAAAGQWLILNIIQDGTGSRTLNWPTIKWPSGVEPPLSTDADAIDTFLIYCATAGGSPVYRGYYAGFNLS